MHSLVNAVREAAPAAERPRLLIEPDPEAVRPYVRAELRVSGAEFVVPAVALALLAVIIFTVGVATDIGEAVTESASGTSAVAATVLVSAFAALSGLVLRVEAHPFVRALLADSRRALGITGLALIVAAAPIGLQLGRTWILAGWGLGIFASLYSVGVLVDAMLRHTDVGEPHESGQDLVRRAD